MGRPLVDDIDRQIVATLSQDGRSSFSQVAAQVALSTSAVKRRVDRLQRVGVLRGFRAVVDWQALGWTVEAFSELRFAGSVPPSDARAALASHPAIVDAFTVAGNADVLVRVRAHDTRHLQDVVSELRREPAIRETRTMVVLEALVEGSYPDPGHKDD